LDDRRHAWAQLAGRVVRLRHRRRHRLVDAKGHTACGITTCETRNPWLATARLRLGYGFDRWLAYVTGGGAFGKVEATNVGFGSASKSSLGWTVGGGLEYAFPAGWSAKAEYLFVDLGKFDCGLSCSVLTPAEVGFSAGIVRAGLNYKFSGPISSRY
jgi:outer membrane immunogenic protein